MMAGGRRFKKSLSAELRLRVSAATRGHDVLLRRPHALRRNLGRVGYVFPFAFEIGIL